MSANEPRHQFSIIVPSHDRPAQLANCLASLACLDYPVDRFAVIVVDDGSRDPPDDVIAGFSERLDLTYLRKPNGGPGSARNAGAAVARGRFLAFTDDDCCPQPAWLRVLAARIEAKSDCIVGGRTRNGLVHNLYSEASQLVLELVYAHYNRDPENARFFASNNMAISADLFRQLGGFEEQRFRHASEDRELCDRWRQSGRFMAYAPDALVDHYHELTLRDFCNQHLRYGRGAATYHAVRAARGSGRMRDEFSFHTRLPGLLRNAFATRRSSRAPALLAFLALWQCFNAAGFVLERLRPRNPATIRFGFEDPR